MAKITLKSIRYFGLEATLEEGSLFLEGDDCAGDDDYEYNYKFDEENTAKLFALIAPEAKTDEEKLEALKNWVDWAKDPGETCLQGLCSEKGVKYEFWCYGGY